MSMIPVKTGRIPASLAEKISKIGYKPLKRSFASDLVVIPSSKSLSERILKKLKL